MTTGRRELLSMLGIGVAVALTGCSSTDEPKVYTAPPVPQPFSRGPAGKIALTIDDGLDDTALAAYVQLAEDTGLALTFCAVGRFQEHWNAQAGRLAALVERDQVQVVNHTYAHSDMRDWSQQRIFDDLDKNEDWIQRTFKTTSRPYFRPPSGYYNQEVQHAAARAGFTRTLLWETSMGDAAGITPDHYVQAAEKAIRSGAVCVGHANFPEATGVYPHVVELIRQRHLTAVTVGQLFHA